MSFTALPQLQRSVIERLKSFDELTALATGGIHDAVPKATAFPYIVFDEPIETPNQTLGQNGHMISVVLAIFTQDGTLDKHGRGVAGYAQGQAMVEKICEALINDDEPMVVDGHDVVLFELDSNISTREDDGVTRRTEVSFTAQLEDDGG